MTITKDELRNFMEEYLEKANILLLRDGHLDAVGFIFVGKEIGVCPLRFKDAKEKHRQLNALKMFAKIKKADAVFVMIESWYVTSDKRDEKIIPSKHPDRKECIFVIGECREGNITIKQNFGRKHDKIILEDKVEMSGVETETLDFGIKKEYDMSYG